MMQDDHAQRPLKIAIAGGGTAGWMAAAALARLTACEVVLIESEAIGTVGVGEATIPQIRLFNRALGIDEGRFLRETKATFKLGIAFDGWRRDGERYMHAFGHVGRGAGLLPFHQLWLRGRELGLAKDLSAYSLNEMAARAGKMRVGQDRAAADMPWACHFDATLYAGFLRRFAQERGVERIEGRILAVERDGESGTIAALALDAERRVEADFFFDCTGFRALLRDRTAGDGFADWSHWLPCDRAVAVPGAPADPIAPYTTATARAAGWQWRIPLQHRTGNGLVYCSEFLSEGDAETLLLDHMDGAPIGAANHLRFTTGMRMAPWQGNCLALGLAAGFLEPLESTSIHLIQSGIARFLAMLPRRDAPVVMAEEFNRQARFEWENIRDFLILHYAANAREGQPFWDRCRAMTLPDRLAARLAMFRATGFVQREHDELFTEPGWVQVLLGQGVVPHTLHPNTDALAAHVLSRMLDEMAAGIASLVETMPTHVEILREFCASPPMPRSAAMMETAR
ncbi:tryptophan halogenase family protein [Croceicoccus hydrothermalis]|uniref:tryptophan halogenase family protein n=1 Tax=Croceicoccus hydrothermalis TaxID=2867964 RepID=UPI001EFB76AC|nr:tryptophan halogenase family protein [Croceicoccus hydrothermalis]